MAIGSLAVRVSSDTTKFNQGMSSAGSTAKRFGSEAADVGKKVAVMGAAVAAAGAAIGIELTRRGLEAVDAQAKLSRQLGGTIDGLKGLQIAGSDAGVSSDILGRAMEKLNSRLGEAQRGSGATFESLERLGLSAQALSDMDVDDRIATIADRMQSMGLSTQEAADELRQMGIRNGEMVNLMIQGGDAIRSAREEVDTLGLSISQVDAAKVEIANDAFARTGLLLEGLSQRMAVEVAPIMTALSDMFVDAATESGNMAETVSDGMDGVVSVIGFVLDAVESVNRAFEIAGKGVALFALGAQDAILTFADVIVNEPIEAINDLIAAFNKIPGVDIEPVGLTGLGAGIRDQLEIVRQAQKEGIQDIHDTIMEPLPSLQFEAFVAKAREDAEAAAQEMSGLGDMLRPDIGGDVEGGTGSGRGENDQEGEKIREQLQGKLEAIREANMAEVELLNEKYAMENEAINAAREQQLITESEWDNLMRQQKGRQEDELTDIEKRAAKAREQTVKAEAANKKAIMGNALSSLTTLMNSESRKMFEIGKVAAIAQSTISTYTAMNKALAELGPIAGPSAAAAIGLAGFANVASIKSQSFGGGGGGAGGAASVTQSINAQGQPVQSQQESSRNLFVQGIDPNQMFSGRQLVELINEAQQDGAQLRVGEA